MPIVRPPTSRADVSTISKPFVSDVSVFPPNFDIQIEGANIPQGVRNLIQRVEYDSSDGMADLLRVIIKDPDTIQPFGLTPIGPLGSSGGAPLSVMDTKLFQPGNEISVRMGYGSKLTYIGRAIIRKCRMSFPRNDMPSLEVIAYTKDSIMMDNSPEGSKKKKGKKGNIGRGYEDTTFADAVREKAAVYRMTPDVDDTPLAPTTFNHIVGLTDYDFINGLSNITGYFFWVDANEEGEWFLHFKNPDTIRREDIQDKTYTFKYNDGSLSSLLEFDPELAIQGATTKITAKVKDPLSGEILEASFEEENDASPETVISALDDETIKVVDEALGGEYTTASDIKIFLSDFSFEARANRSFRSVADLTAWVRQWFRRNRENFILSSGIIIGVESIYARQVHKLSGLPSGLSGEYYFSNVQHTMDADEGYTIEFTSRKHVPELP